MATSGPNSAAGKSQPGNKTIGGNGNPPKPSKKLVPQPSGNGQWPKKK